jgi:hypothetical protein
MPSDSIWAQEAALKGGVSEGREMVVKSWKRGMGRDRP